MKLNRRTRGGPDRGKKSSKSNQDCTIRVSCRSAMSGSAGSKQRAYRLNWQA